MRVELDNDRRQIDLRVDNGIEPFLEVLKQALVAIGYTREELMRVWDEEDN